MQQAYNTLRKRTTKENIRMGREKAVRACVCERRLNPISRDRSSGALQWTPCKPSGFCEHSNEPSGSCEHSNERSGSCEDSNEQPDCLNSSEAEGNTILQKLVITSRHGVAFQKARIFSNTAVKTSNFAYELYYCLIMHERHRHLLGERSKFLFSIMYITDDLFLVALPLFGRPV